MFIKPNPPGCNKPLECDRMHIVKVVSGDAWKVDAKLVNPSNGMPANYRNTCVKFVLSENKFNHFPIWVGEWSKGVFEDKVVPGLVHVIVPEDVAGSLRRGTYAFSIAVTDIDGLNKQTQLSGYFEVEYEPSAPVHDIPYRTDADTSSSIYRYLTKMDEEQQAELLKILEEIWTGEGTINNMEDGVRVIAEFLLKASRSNPGREDNCNCDDILPGEDVSSIEKKLSSVSDSIENLVSTIKEAIAKNNNECGKHHCDHHPPKPLPPPPPPPHPPRPLPPPLPPPPWVKPFIFRPPWYRYPNPPKHFNPGGNPPPPPPPKPHECNCVHKDTAG